MTITIQQKILELQIPISNTLFQEDKVAEWAPEIFCLILFGQDAACCVMCVRMAWPESEVLVIAG